MRNLLCFVVLLLAPVCSFAGITVTHFTDASLGGAELDPTDIYLDGVYEGGSYPTASIRNLYHLDYYDDCYGESKIGFLRHRITKDDCLYFFRAEDVGDNDPANGTYYALETHARTYWMAENALVDGATWGSDNYLVMHDSERGVVVAILQLDFNESTGKATLLASAINFDGLTFTEGVAAINAPIPEPAGFAVLAAVGTLAFAAGRRRRRAPAA